MSKLRTFWNLATGSRKFVGALGNNGILNWMRDDKYLELLYKEQMGKKLNLKNPVSFNEKLQWLKVNDHNERYFDLVNKIKAKEVVGNIIGKEHIVPIYKIWDKAELISFEDLPDKFVLKCNHDQGSVVLVDDKKTVDISNIAVLPVNGAIILIIISIFLTVIAGFIPAKIASRKDPVEALRSE